MKKSSISIIILAAAAALTLSCAKEAAPEQTPEAAKSEVSGGHTFTATMGQDTKVNIADDGTCTWKAGDWIFVFNGSGEVTLKEDGTSSHNIPFSRAALGGGSAGTVTYNDEIVAETIQVTQDMISADGKSLTFTTQVATPTDNYKMWYFIAFSDWDTISSVTLREDQNLNYFSILLNRMQSSVTSSTRQIVCWGQCGADDTAFTLYHHDSQFRFTCSSADYDEVQFAANGDASDSNYINPDRHIYPRRVKDYTASTWTYTYMTCYEYSRSTYNTYSDGTYISDRLNVTLSGNADDVYYVPVPELYTWANGITITLLKDGTAVKTLTISKSLSTSHGDIINFGDLASVTPAKTYTSYYEMWQDGKDITIGDTKYNKNDSGLTAVQVTSDSNFDTVWKGEGSYIYFISEGVTLTNNKTYYPTSGSYVFIGDKIGTRSNVDFSLHFCPKGGTSLVAYKNLELAVVQSSTLASNVTNGLVVIADGILAKAVLDDCKVDLSTRGRAAGMFASQSNSGITNAAIVDSDIIFPGEDNKLTDNVGVFIFTSKTAVSGGSLVFTNNLCYTADGKSPFSGTTAVGCGVAHDIWTGTLTYENIDFENNTFIGAFYLYGLVVGAGQLVSSGGTMTISDNLVYVPSSNTSGLAGYVKMVQLPAANITGVTATASNNWGWAAAYTDGTHNYAIQTYGNYSASVFSADPFDTSDGATYEPSTGTFVLSATAKSAAGSVGASR